MGHPYLSAQANSDAHIMAITQFKLPEFWTNDPEIWFIHIEAQFATRNIRNDNSMYQAVVGALKPEVLREVSDILRAPPPQDKYNYLKTNLIKRFTDSVDRQLYKLLTELELGNRKPSQLLREMRTLAGTRASEELLRSRWLALLPDIVCKILKAVQNNSTLDELAEAADSAMENHTSSKVMSTGFQALPLGVQAISTGALQSKTNFSLDARNSIEQRLSSLEKAMETLANSFSELSNKLNESSKSRSRSRSRTPGASGHCFYHNRFGERAHRCLQPCSFRPSAKQGN